MIQGSDEQYQYWAAAAVFFTLLGIWVAHRIFIRQQHQEALRSPSDAPPWTVGIIGAGAVGTVAGLKLLDGDAKANKQRKINKVVLVGRAALWQQLHNSNNNNEAPSLTVVEDFFGGSTTSFSVTNSPRLEVVDSTDKDTKQELKRLLQSCHIILIATKTIHTRRFAKDLAEMLNDNESATDMSRTILSLQNGLQNAQILQEHLRCFPNVECFASVVAFAAEWEQDSTRFHINLPGGKILMPLLPNHNQQSAVHRDRIQTLARLWTRANLPSQMTKLLRIVQYLKLLINLINPINALAGVTVPVQMLDCGYRSVLAETIREGADIMCRSEEALRERTMDRWIVWMIGYWIIPGILTYLPDILFQVSLGQQDTSSSSAAPVSSNNKKNNNNNTGPNYKSSMLQDLERRRPKTEMDDLSGYIVKLGQANGYPVPHNSKLCELIGQAEKARIGSPRLAAKDLCKYLGL